MSHPLAVEVTTLIATLDTAVVAVAVAPAPEAVVASVSILDADDLVRRASASDRTPADVVLAVGVDHDALADWLAQTGDSGRSGREAVVVFTKPALASQGELDDVTGMPQLVRAASAAGIALVVVDPRARWDRVLTTIQDVLDRGADTEVGSGTTHAVDVDLVGLVGLIAHGTGGLVSIEDATSARVLAYSPSRGEADDLRAQTILGRAGPPNYLSLLREWGVFDAIRRGGEVIDVPERAEQGMRRRLVIGVHSGTGRHLGSIWVQEGQRPLADDAPDVLRGAAAMAARILIRELQAPSAETQLVQRVFGAHGGVDPSTASAYLRLSADDPVSVIGLAAVGGASVGHEDVMASVGGIIRLHASAYASTALTAVIGARAYILLPAGGTSLTRWVDGLVTRFDGDPLVAGARLRAAVVASVPGLVQVPTAREEVDRVLDATGDATERVTSLDRSRTEVLLGEILTLIAGRADLVDPRVTTLVRYDQDHDADLVRSVRAFLNAHGNVRDAAAAVGVHPNTLRYRLDRAEQLSGLHLDRATDRLLTGIQLAVRERHHSDGAGPAATQSAASAR